MKTPKLNRKAEIKVMKQRIAALDKLEQTHKQTIIQLKEQLKALENMEQPVPPNVQALIEKQIKDQK